ncbi:MAG: nicotinamide riboside transporter PnuC [Comamonadaceae bacterium]|nr:MAG: nicotinamide riboside transporter PnuC [Comamonadaceae bacterium]
MTLWNQSTSLLEIAAFLSGLCSVWLTRRLHIGNWPAGIVSCVCFGVLFVEARLYADALLQIAFIVLGLYGWRSWALARSRTGEVPVSRATGGEVALGLALAAAGTFAAAWVLGRFTDSPVPLPDAAILVLSLIATWAQARSRIECWLVWIVVDVISIPLYWSRGLPLTAVLYVLFLLICLGGLASWRQRLPAPREAMA